MYLLYLLGYNVDVSFECNWISTVANIMESSINDNDRLGVCVGSLACLIHNDKKGRYKINYYY
jgi:hypothetical protein